MNFRVYLFMMLFVQKSDQNRAFNPEYLNFQNIYLYILMF